MSGKEKRDMKVEPLGDRIVIKQMEGEDQIGSIIVPETSKEKPGEGEVIAVGPGRRLEDGSLLPVEVEVGDVILFGKYTGSQITVDGKDLIIIRESDVMGRLSDGSQVRGESGPYDPKSREFIVRELDVMGRFIGDFVDDVDSELREVDRRRCLLADFLESDVADKLSDEERERLRRQCLRMQDYSSVLRERLESFEDDDADDDDDVDES